MKYALYVTDGPRPEEFLNAASGIAYLKKDRNQLLRWLDLSDYKIQHGEDAFFTIYEDGVPILRRGYLGKRHGVNWTAIKSTKEEK